MGHFMLLSNKKIRNLEAETSNSTHNPLLQTFVFIKKSGYLLTLQYVSILSLINKYSLLVGK